MAASRLGHDGLPFGERNALAKHFDQEVANVLLTRPDLHGIVTARRLARATLNRIHRNFAISLVANSLFIAGGLFMILQPGLSALLHNLTTLGVSLYAMRPYLPAEQNETLDTAAAEAEA